MRLRVNAMPSELKVVIEEFKEFASQNNYDIEVSPRMYNCRSNEKGKCIYINLNKTKKGENI